MKNLTKLVSTGLIALMVVGPVTAAPVWSDVSLNVQLAAGAEGNVYVNLNGDTVTLSGFVDNYYTSNAVIRAASKTEGVDRVINNMFVR